ncbi:hypothetical protein DFJ43DRAFT_250669 [Lentinula guzmanii]|uniref:Uncharacterized protein n=1 Tax=Lentinula guzmanii TaxID=2804957 RepID=A0AA38N4R6_9AGAR|nr:hypothetical protein DFJ43DRAFT_250669 [Lentinula guzmanii]KAJ3802100.1 hypothetical protein GGU11DRAFT_697012 [Lentinula aff. detonsa]
MSMIFNKNDIYAALTRSDVRGAFHWAIYLVIDQKTGYRLHATTHGGRTPWEYECVLWDGPEFVLAVTFTLIGQLHEDLDVECLEAYVKDIPMNIIPRDQQREPKFTCRVWFKEAIRQIHASGMFVNCPDVDALERELLTKTTAMEYLGDERLPVQGTSACAKPWS